MLQQSVVLVKMKESTDQVDNLLAYSQERPQSGSTQVSPLQIGTTMLRTRRQMIPILFLFVS